MSTNLVQVGKETRLAKPGPEFSNEQIRLLAETVAKGCDQNELAFFLQVCKLKRLDPFSGQVHCVKRWDSQLNREKVVVQVGIDGFRVNAARTDELAGIDDAVYDSEAEDHPKWAKVTVYRYGRGDDKIPYTATARWGEYVQKKKDGSPAGKWVQMPYLMLGKCAEALALRKAFPDELSGMYTNEEMEQADSEGVAPASLGKPPVSMPKSTDEKKPAAQTQQRESKEGDTKTQSASTTTGSTTGGNAAATEKISGEIEKVSPGKGAQEGTLWLVVNKKVICVPKELIDAEMCAGAKILLTVTELKGGTVQKYLATAVEMVVPPVVEGEVVDAEYEDVPEAGATVEQHAAAVEGMGEDLFGKGTQKAAAPASEPTTEATKPGTAGMARAKRLHTLITQNWKNTGFDEAKLKQYLATQRIEHARDLIVPQKGSDAFNAYEYACGMAVGEIDWHEVLED